MQDHPENLFTLLGHTYEMRVSEEATNLCPARLCERPNDPGGAARLTQLADDASIVYSYLVAPDALRERLPSINDRWRNFRDSEGRGEAVPRNGVLSRLAGGERPQRFRGAVAAIQPGKRPTLDFIHTLLPHEPLEYLPAGQRYKAGAQRDPSLDGPPSYDDPFLTDQAFQRHLLQAGYVDRLLGELIGQLQREGLWDRALVVLDGRPRRIVPRQADSRAAVRAGAARLPPRPDAGERPGHRHGAAVREVPRAGGGPDRPRPGGGRSTCSPRSPTCSASGFRSASTVARCARRGPCPTRCSTARATARRIDVDRAALERAKAESLSHQVALLGTGTWDRAYRIGPHPELIGRAVESLETLPRGQLKASVEDAGKLAQVDPDSSVSPSQIAGRLSGGDPAGHDLAFALNGRIVSMGRSFADIGPHGLNFSSMLPPEAFRRGANKLDVYELVASGGTVGLVPLGPGS